MGTGDMIDPDVENKKRPLFAKRIKRRYYFTKGRLSQSQISVLLLLFAYCDSDGESLDLRKRVLCEKTGYTIQTINNAIKRLESLGFITLGPKEYGYVSYQIKGYKTYFQKKMGGFYVMSRESLDIALNQSNVHRLRIYLASLLDHDLSYHTNQATFISWGKLSKIIPSVCYPKALKNILKSSKNDKCEFVLKESGIEFFMDSEVYGKNIRKTEENLAKDFLDEKRNHSLKLKEKEDVISLSIEYGFVKVATALDFMSKHIKEQSESLGALIRNIIENENLSLEGMAI